MPIATRYVFIASMDVTPEKEAPDYFAGDWFEFHSLWVPTGRTGKARLKICGYVPPL